MITRLYKPKDRTTADGDKIQLMTLKYGEDGKEQWQPVKQVCTGQGEGWMGRGGEGVHARQAEEVGVWLYSTRYTTLGQLHACLQHVLRA